MSNEIEQRDCGDCSLCCKLLSVQEPTLQKPAGKWCAWCDIGKGCRIHAERPGQCRAFLCAWAQGIQPAHLVPTDTRVVVSWTTDGKYPVAYVDPHRPNAWTQGDFGRWFNAMVSTLGRGIIVCGQQRKFVGHDLPPNLKQYLEGVLQ